MKDLRAQLARRLADGRFHSGESLARDLGVSRSAVWKHVRALAGLGLDIQSVPGRGYRLAEPLELLDADAIRAALPVAWRERLGVAAAFSLDSTSARLAALPDAALPAACLAEHQSAGRGRRGRVWVSPPGGNLYLSLGWRFAALPPDFPALGLAAGVAVCEALAGFGLEEPGLKWPNDLVAQGGKLGGLLLEVSGEPPGPCRVILGLGLNLRMPRDIEVGQAWTELAALGPLPGRNRLAAALLGALCAMLDTFATAGFAPFRGAWERRDVLRGRLVEVRTEAGRVQGRALGVAADGALRLWLSDGERRFYSGEVSVRMTA